jgi:KUP system potassium uptake protein
VKAPGSQSHRQRRAGVAVLALGALGVVFGDIGTSPLYALQTLFSADHYRVEPTEGDVFGVISLVFWAITLVVSIEFVVFVMRADNDGEGGILALIALVSGARLRRRWAKPLLIALGLVGVALFYGDGMITPAISVLSAAEGLEVAAPGLKDLIVPITIGVLVALFAIQRFGTGAIGRLFGPVMVVWFAVIAAIGVAQIVTDPAILEALSPLWAFDFIVEHPGVAFVALGAVVLTITGAEALYADMGHFGRPPISRAWFLVVFPALTLNYLGQGSLILQDPSAIENPFFLLVPEWGQLAMVGLATVATVIASQAVISGAFSVTTQAMRLGFLPRLRVRHTSASEIGQVYLPAVNWALLAAVVALVVGFGSSTKLGSAYGVAVTGTITIDTLLFLVVARALWRKPLWLVGLGAVVFFTVDLVFIAGNLAKAAHGGWFPLTVGVVMFTVLSTWRRGSARVRAARAEEEGELADFVARLPRREPPPARVPGTAVYLNARPDTTPLALLKGVEHTGALRETAVIFSLQTTRAPHVPEPERLRLDQTGAAAQGIFHLTATLGYQDVVDVPRLLALAAESRLVPGLDVPGAVYFVSGVAVGVGEAPGMSRWRKHLFVAMSRNAGSPLDYFHLPRERTVILTSAIEL